MRKQRLNLVELMSAAVVAACVLGSTANGQILHDWDFEDGTTHGLIASGNSPTATRDYAREGVWSQKAHLDRQKSSTSYRSESSASGYRMDMGREYWIGFSIYLPETHVPSDVWEIVFQAFRLPDDWKNYNVSNPVFSISVIDDEYRAVIRYNKVLNGGQDHGQVTAVNRSLGAFETGRWTDFVINVKWHWATGKGAFTKLWVDGDLLIDYVGPNAFNDTFAPYLKFGLYKGWRDRVSPSDTVTTRTVYHDAVRVADETGSYLTVAPRGGASTRRPRSPAVAITAKSP